MNFILVFLYVSGASFLLIMEEFPGRVTLDMTGYAHAYTNSVEKGTFLIYDVVDVFCKRGIFFTANRTSGVPNESSSSLFRAENGIGKQHFENLCKIVKNDMIYELCLYLKCDTSSPLFQFKKSLKAFEC